MINALFVIAPNLELYLPEFPLTIASVWINTSIIYWKLAYRVYILARLA